MRTVATARHRHGIKTGKRDSASLYKTSTQAHQPWSIAELESSRARALARGDVEYAEMRRLQIQTRIAQLEMENATEGQETPPEGGCGCDLEHDPDSTQISQAQQREETA